LANAVKGHHDIAIPFFVEYLSRCVKFERADNAYLNCGDVLGLHSQPHVVAQRDAHVPRNDTEAMGNVGL
jgi:hypothetical protein